MNSLKAKNYVNTVGIFLKRMSFMSKEKHVSSGKINCF